MGSRNAPYLWEKAEISAELSHVRYTNPPARILNFAQFFACADAIFASYHHSCAVLERNTRSALVLRLSGNAAADVGAPSGVSAVLRGFGCWMSAP
jgi:hypothetical protein